MGVLMKNIIITGSESGIGKATCELLSEEYNIIRLDKKLNVDLSHEYSIKTIHEIVEKIGKPDIYAIVNCAGICIKKPFYEYTEEDWENTVKTNIRPLWLLTKLFLRELKSSQGRIINISSIHAKSTLNGNAVYAMSKGAVESFNRGLAIELAPLGITVNCLRLGSVDTPMLNHKRGMEKTIPIGYIAQPEEVAKVIRFLLDDNSSYMTGSCIDFDGGILSKASVVT